MALSAAAKRAGHRCGLVVADLEADPAGAVLGRNPDVIAFSVTTGEVPFMTSLIETLRPRFSGKIIAGGVHPTFYPEILESCGLDAVCVGEGDRALCAYLDALSRGGDGREVLNFHVKTQKGLIRQPLRPLIGDLDRLPDADRRLYPDAYSLYRKKNHDLLYHRVVMTGRGCPGACAFCFNPQYNALYQGKGTVVRRRSAARIIAEVKALTACGKTLFVTFDDDSFTLAPRSWLDNFCRAYGREIGLPFKINSVAGALSEKRVRMLKQAGCHAVKIGLESGNETLRTGLLSKKVSNQSLIRAADRLRQHGILLQTFNMVGLPGETLDQALETYALNRRLRPAFLWCSLLNPYPGTAIHRHCLDTGRLKSQSHNSCEPYSYFNQSPLDPAPELVRLQKRMFAFLLLRLPTRLVRHLIRIPAGPLDRFVFGLTMVVGLAQINRLSLARTLGFAWRYLSRYGDEE